MKLGYLKEYIPENWNEYFAWFPTVMSNGRIIWLEKYKERAYNTNNWAAWDFERMELEK